MKTADRIIVKRGEVNINVVASDTGINFIHANDVSIIRLPDIPTKINIILCVDVFGQIEPPKS